MTISSPEREAKKVKIAVDRNPVETSFEKWAKPGHFSRTLSKGPNTTTWIWNLHADAHDFDSHTSDLEEISRKVFSAHFGQLGVIFIWLSGMYFHGARFSNYEAWLSDPTHIKPSAQVVWPVVGQEILNGDVGGGFQGIQITSGFFQLWRASGITSELQLYTTAIGGLVMAAAMFFAGWFHYHKAAPKLEWFRNVESMLNHHLAGLLGLGSLSWAGHQIHVSLPVNKLLDAGVDPKEIPLPHDLLLNRQIMADLYPSFAKGLAPFFTLQWGEYSDFLTFNGGLNPVTGGLWLSDTAHHHLAIAVLFLVAGHMYRTNWGIGHSMKEILDKKAMFTKNMSAVSSWSNPSRSICLMKKTSDKNVIYLNSDNSSPTGNNAQQTEKVLDIKEQIKNLLGLKGHNNYDNDVTFMTYPGIYEIRNTKNNKRYIGQSKIICGRLRDHKANLEASIHECAELQKDWTDYGAEAFTFHILECHKSKWNDEILRLIAEKWYQLEYEDQGIILYNQQKLRPFLQKMDQIKPLHNSIPVQILNLQFPSVNKAASFLGCSGQLINKSLMDPNNTVVQYVEQNKHESYRRSNVTKPVLIGDVYSGQYYESVRHAVIAEKMNADTLRKRIKDPTKEYYFVQDLTQDELDILSKRFPDKDVLRPNKDGRKVWVDDVCYDSITETAVAFGCSLKKVRRRCVSKKFPNWVYANPDGSKCIK